MPKHLIYRKWHLLSSLFLPVSSFESSSRVLQDKGASVGDEGD